MSRYDDFENNDPIILQENIRRKIVRVTSISLVALVSISNAVLFILVEPMQIRGFYEEYQILYNTFPNISGNIVIWTGFR